MATNACLLVLPVSPELIFFMFTCRLYYWRRHGGKRVVAVGSRGEVLSKEKLPPRRRDTAGVGGSAASAVPLWQLHDQITPLVFYLRRSQERGQKASCSNAPSSRSVLVRAAGVTGIG